MSSPTRSQLSLNKFRCLRPQAARKLTTRRCRICPELRRVGLFAMTANLRRHHVPQQSDEKERHCDRIDPQNAKWDKSPSASPPSASPHGHTPRAPCTRSSKHPRSPLRGTFAEGTSSRVEMHRQRPFSSLFPRISSHLVSFEHPCLFATAVEQRVLPRGARWHATEQQMFRDGTLQNNTSSARP